LACGNFAQDDSVERRLRRDRPDKKAGTKDGPGIELAGCPDKVEALSRPERAAQSGDWEPAAEILRLRFLQPKDPRVPNSIPSAHHGKT
jgi:hypothetical protein